jgi:hypothetical protein
MPVKAEEVEAKIQKGETLSKEEEKFVKSTPKSSDPSAPVVEEEEEAEIPDDDAPSGIKKEKSAEEESEPGKPAAPEKKAADEAEESPSEKKEAKAADGKSPEKDEITAEVRKKLEKELEKPEGHEDLSGYSPKEVGLFFDLRKQRARAQRAEEENELLKFERMQGQLKEKEKPAEKLAQEEDPFAGRDDDDILTVADVKKLLGARKEAPAAKGDGEITTMTQLLIQNQKLEARITLKEKGISDMDEVIDYAQDILGGDPDAKEYLTRVAAKKGNVVLATYNLIKASPKWPDVEKAVRTAKGEKIPAENQERARKLEENEKKVRTTGAGGGGATNSDEYTVGEILSMSTDDFGKLPKAKRRAIMEKYGSTPNRSV